MSAAECTVRWVKFSMLPLWLPTTMLPIATAAAAVAILPTRMLKTKKKKKIRRAREERTATKKTKTKKMYWNGTSSISIPAKSKGGKDSNQEDEDEKDVLERYQQYFNPGEEQGRKGQQPRRRRRKRCTGTVPAVFQSRRRTKGRGFSDQTLQGSARGYHLPGLYLQLAARSAGGGGRRRRFAPAGAHCYGRRPY